MAKKIEEPDSMKKPGGTDLPKGVNQSFFRNDKKLEEHNRKNDQLPPVMNKKEPLLVGLFLWHTIKRIFSFWSKE